MELSYSAIKNITIGNEYEFGHMTIAEAFLIGLVSEKYGRSPYEMDEELIKKINNSDILDKPKKKNIEITNEEIKKIFKDLRNSKGLDYSLDKLWLGISYSYFQGHNEKPAKMRVQDIHGKIGESYMTGPKRAAFLDGTNMYKLKSVMNYGYRGWGSNREFSALPFYADNIISVYHNEANCEEITPEFKEGLAIEFSPLLIGRALKILIEEEYDGASCYPKDTKIYHLLHWVKIFEQEYNIEEFKIKLPTIFNSLKDISNLTFYRELKI